VIVEVHGLEVFGRHGVNDDERRDGQRFFVDITLRIPEPTEDTIEATVDYRGVRDVVRTVNDGTSFRLLETFAVAVADAILAQLGPEHVTVRVRKPGVAWAEWAAASVERP
jgi:dihydroneopterin aldolase